MDESANICKILIAIRDHTEDSLFFDDLQGYVRANDKIKAHGLAEQDGTRSRRLTVKGYQVLEAGSFDKWLEANKRREVEDRQVTADTLTFNKKSFRVALVSVIFSTVPVTVGVLQYLDSKSKDKEISEIRSALKSLSQQLQAQKASHIKTPYRADSLPSSRNHNK